LILVNLKIKSTFFNIGRKWN